MSSGSISLASAVEPTKSENNTVTWRRSASCVSGVVGDASGWVGGGWSAASAFKSFRRCPRERPSFSKSLSARSERTSKSISLSASTPAYCSRPSSLSHSCSFVIGLQGSLPGYGGRIGGGIEDSYCHFFQRKKPAAMQENPVARAAG